MTIGERIEEARKRRGISIREAADATKIRSDFLLSMEKNAMDEINLPEIYRRGFLKCYAKYLKLDPEKIMTDYNALRIGSKKGDKYAPTSGFGGRKDSDSNRRGEMLGRMEIPDEGMDEGSAHRNDSNDDSVSLAPNLNYIKMGMVGLGVIVLIFCGVLMFKWITKPSAEMTDLNNTSVVSPMYAEETIKLVALGDVTLIVDQVEDRAELFRGTLKAGDTQSLRKTGPVNVRYTKGELVVVERNGQRITMDKKGMGFTRLP
jgi:transcriptional regulator with XRE-family HTH domain